MDLKEFVHAVFLQGQLLYEKASHIKSLKEKLEAIMSMLFSMSTVPCPSPTTPVDKRAETRESVSLIAATVMEAPKIPFPDNFDGNPSECR